jgi:hypothetical protein
MRRADELAGQWMKYRRKQFGMFAAQYGGALALQAFTNVALLGAGAWLVLDGGLSLGQLVAAEFIVASALIGFAKFSGKLESAYDLLAAVDKVGVLVDLPVEPAGGVVSQAEGAATVRLSAVGGHGLQGVDLMVSAGERLAILSEPGSARHALAEALSGLWRPSQGRVLWDGVDASDVHLPVVAGPLAAGAGVGGGAGLDRRQHHLRARPRRARRGRGGGSGRGGWRGRWRRCPRAWTPRWARTASRSMRWTGPGWWWRG